MGSGFWTNSRIFLRRVERMLVWFINIIDGGLSELNGIPVPSTFSQYENLTITRYFQGFVIPMAQYFLAGQHLAHHLELIGLWLSWIDDLDHCIAVGLC